MRAQKTDAHIQSVYSDFFLKVQFDKKTSPSVLEYQRTKTNLVYDSAFSDLL